MLEQKYYSRLAESSLERDDSQLALVHKLEKYRHKIDAPQKIIAKILGSLQFKHHKHSRGIYIWGDVGRGKSMLMDLFYDSLETDKKLRVHFHEFVKDFHKSLDQWRKKHKENESAADPIPQLAKEISRKYRVICFDELQVTNIADAMILHRLFDSLIGFGTYLVITSNRRPSDLYKDGLQRERFLPFIHLVKAELEIFELNNFKDYRMDKLRSIKHSYITPLDSKNEAVLGKIIKDLTGHTELNEVDVYVDQSKVIKSVRAYGNLAVFTFRELCELPYGAIDYLALCNHFNTIIIKNIPQLNSDNHNEALRFITLIDCMYENRTKLICTAANKPELLYNNGKNAFEFQRTASRLNEMQSEEYIFNEQNS